MDILFKAIAERLENNIPDIRWLDMEQGQLEWMDENYLIDFPAVFVEVGDVVWRDVGKKVQDGVVTINVRVAFDVYNDLHKGSPDRDKGLEQLQLVNTIQKYLQGFYGSHFNRLNRTRTIAEKREDGLKVYTMVYTCQMRDQSAVDEVTTTTVTTLTLTPEKELD